MVLLFLLLVYLSPFLLPSPFSRPSCGISSQRGTQGPNIVKQPARGRKNLSLLFSQKQPAAGREYREG